MSDSDPPLDGPVRNDPNYVLGPGPDDPILIVAILEVIVALACVGTAVVLYSVVKRQHEEIAMGFVGSRVLEAATIFVGVVTLLSVVPLRQAAVGADALGTSQALVAVNNWTFVLGRSFLPVVNALLLGSLLYPSRLVPRIIPLVGRIGAPLLLVSDLGVLFGIWPQVSALTAIGALPIALWEFSLGVWLVVKCFKRLTHPMEGFPPASRKEMIMAPSEAVHGPRSLPSDRFSIRTA